MVVNMEFESQLASLVSGLREVIGGDPGGFIPLHEPEFIGAEWALVKDCLDSGWVSSVGKYVDRFEEQVAEICGVDHGVAVVNGTAALQIALQVVGVRPGDEVVMQALTFVATANAATHAGAVPHFVDVAPGTLGLDPHSLSARLSEVAEKRGSDVFNRETGRRIAAILPMHTFGHPVDMDAVLEVADAWGLAVVEDAAEALGSCYHERPCGGLGRIAAISFNGNKIITTGGGGALVTNDPELARRAKHLTTTAKVPHRWAFDHDEVGYNFRLPNLNAALGCAQLDQLSERLDKKRRLARNYIDAFEDCTLGQMFTEPKFSKSNYWLNTFILDPQYAQRRDIVLARLNDAGIMARPAWTPLHQLAMYRDAPRTELPVSEDLFARIINIPSSAKLAD